MIDHDLLRGCRLVELTDRVADEEVRRLLASVYVGDDPDGHVERLVSLYRAGQHRLFGWETTADWAGPAVSAGAPVACIGTRPDGQGVYELGSVATLPALQRRGLCSTLIVEVARLLGARRIWAETDADAVDFYRSAGFAVLSLGEKYPGVERFECTWDVSQSTDKVH